MHPSVSAVIWQIHVMSDTYRELAKVLNVGTEFRHIFQAFFVQRISSERVNFWKFVADVGMNCHTRCDPDVKEKQVQSLLHIKLR